MLKVRYTPFYLKEGFVLTILGNGNVIFALETIPAFI